jgi:hypothetical protein
MREPGDRVRLAAARRVLDQVPLPCTVFAHIRQRLPDQAQLMVARPDLPALLSPGAWILLLDDLRVVLQDVGQALPASAPLSRGSRS